jgi:hypothetical protein
MKNIFGLFFVAILTSFVSCGDKVENSLPPEPPVDSIIVTNGFDYYIDFTVDGISMVLKNNENNVGNGVFKQDFGSCSGGNETKFSSYFAYVSDTTKKEWIGFGLANCVHDSANGITDSTFYVFSFPVEIANPDTAVAFINYMDADSVFWSSSLGSNGLSAQSSHLFNVTEVTRNYDGFSALKVKGNFTGWVYNGTGDSLLVSKAEFYSRAWAL